MSNNFEWQTEEDDGLWDEMASTPEPERPSSRRGWWALLAVAALAIVAGTLVYRQIRQQADAAVAAIEVDVVSTHNLVLTAVEQGDVDLLRALLSGRDMRWVAAQEAAVDGDVFYNREPLGLTWQPSSHTVISTTINPELDAANLFFEQRYDVMGASESVTLRQTAVYRLGAQRWLLSPPEDEFWGDWERNASEQLLLVYPARDAEVAEQLFPYLESALMRACTMLADISCADDLQVIVRLEKDPTALANLANPAELYAQRLRLDLPAPSLVGIPQDAVGMEALANGYAAQLAASVITAQIGWRCCEHAPIYQALVDYQLGELGLRPWPITVEDHVQLWHSTQNVSLDNLFEWWATDSFGTLTAEEERQLYAAIDFLLREEGGVTPAQMQRAMNGDNVTFLRWMRDLFAENGRPRSQIVNWLNNEWRRFATVRSAVDLSQSTPPIPLPDQDLQFICTQEGTMGGGETALYRYRLAAEAWQQELSESSFGLMFPLPQDQGVILQSIAQGEGDVSETRLWQDGAMQVLATENQFSLSLGQLDPLNQYLTVYRQIDDPDNSGNVEVLIDLINVQDCSADGCERYDAPGTPTWSPDGKWVIYQDQSSFTPVMRLSDNRIWMFDSSPIRPAPELYLESREQPADTDALRSIGQGSAPFWIDDRTFGYVQHGTAEEHAIVIQQVGDSRSKMVIPVEELATALAEIAPPETSRLTIHYAVSRPQHPDDLFIVVSDQSDAGYLLLLNLESGEVEARMELGFLFTHLLGFSPDGRYVAATTFKSRQAFSNDVDNFLSIHDIEKNESSDLLFNFPDAFPPFVFDWSADGAWLVTTLDEGLLQLVAPSHDYRRLVEYDFGACQGSVAWINR